MNWKNCVNKILLWDTKLNDFIPIIPVDNARGYQKLCVNPEQTNLNGMKIRVSYAPIIDIIERKHDGTEITGLFGESWNLLGQYLNFTTIPDNLEDHHISSPDEKNRFIIADLMRLNQTDISLPSEYSPLISKVSDYLSLTSSCYHLYVPPRLKSDDSWIFKIIAPDVLIIILAMIIFISILISFVNKNLGKYRNTIIPTNNFGDYFFYTFAAFTNQGSSSPTYIEECSRLLTITKRMLAWLFITMSTANLFYLMSKKEIDAPFTDIPSLLDNTDMKLLIRPNSPGWSKLLPDVAQAVEHGRIEFVDKVIDMYGKVNQSDTVLWQSEIIQSTVGTKHNSHLVPIGTCLTKDPALFSISKNFHYKRSLAIGILKLHESGLMHVIKQQWLGSPPSFIPEPYDDVSWMEVRAIFIIYLMGLVTSVIILVIERMTYTYKRRYLRKKWNQRLQEIAQRLNVKKQY